MEEKDSAISGPYEEFRICFCGKIPSGSVEWYLIDVSVEEACLSEKKESSTRELTRFSVAKHLPSYAALGGLIYSLGGQRRSYGGGDTLLNDVWLLDFKFLEDLKPGSGKAQAQAQAQSPWAVMEPELVPGLKPNSGKAHRGEYWKPDSDKTQTQAQAQAHWKTESDRAEDLMPQARESDWAEDLMTEEVFHKLFVVTDVDMSEEDKLKLVPGRKPGSGKAPDSDKAQAQSPRAVMEPELARGPKPDSGKARKPGSGKAPDSDKAQAQSPRAVMEPELARGPKPDSGKARKPGSGKAPDSDKAQAQSPRAVMEPELARGPKPDSGKARKPGSGKAPDSGKADKAQAQSPRAVMEPELARGPKPDSGKARKPGSGKAPDSDKAQAQSPRAVMEPELARGPKPDSGKARKPGSGKAPDSDKAQAQSPRAVMEPELARGPKPDSGKARKPGSCKAPDSDKAQAQSPRAVMEPELARGPKPDSGKAHRGEYWKPDSDKTQAQAHWKTESENFSYEDCEAKVFGETDVDMSEETHFEKMIEDWDAKVSGSDMVQAYLGPPFLALGPPLLALGPPLGGRKTSPPTLNWKPGSDMVQLASMGENTAADILTGRKPDSDKASPTILTAPSVEDWKPGLPMNFARYNPHTMVVDHKLYVLGGFLPNQNQADGWIEFFDPEENKWEPLPGPPEQIHSSIMISGLLKSKKEIIIAKQRWDCHPLLFYSYNITTRRWNPDVPPESELSVHSDSKARVHSNVERAVILPPNIGRAVTVGNTLYWISTEEHNHECTIRAYDLDRNMWFEDHLNTATIFGRREYFSSIYSRGPGFLHLVDQKFCLLLQSTVKKKDPQSSIEYLYCVILDISPIYEHEHEDWGKFELTTVSVQKYSMDHYIDFLDCMLLDRVSGVKSVDRRGQSTSTTSVSSSLRGELQLH